MDRWVECRDRERHGHRKRIGGLSVMTENIMVTEEVEHHNRHPENVMVTEEGQVGLAVFSIEILSEGGSSAHPSPPPSHAPTPTHPHPCKKNHRVKQVKIGSHNIQVANIQLTSISV